MFLKSIPAIFIFLAIIISFGNSEHCAVNKCLVVSTIDHPSACESQNDHCSQEIQAALRTLNENITIYLQKLKQEILQESENKLNEKLSKMKQEIIASVQTVTIKIPRDCKEVQTKGYQDSGIYRIQPDLVDDEFSVFCDMTTRGGGWTSVLNRVDGSQDFFLNWTDYRNGFGNLSGEYWMGLEPLYHLTNTKPNELFVELVDWDLKKVHAHYSRFKIGSNFDGYKLKTLEGYTGDAGDSLKGHLGSKFSTLDRDQDTNPGSCASIFRGGWWYSSCFESHLTGRYVKNSNPVPQASGLHWQLFHGFQRS